jgi:hypothetical protein
MELFEGDIIHIRARATAVIDMNTKERLVHVGTVPLHVSEGEIVAIEARPCAPGDKVKCYLPGAGINTVQGEVIATTEDEVWVKHESGRCLTHPLGMVRPA